MNNFIELLLPICLFCIMVVGSITGTIVAAVVEYQSERDINRRKDTEDKEL